MEHIHELNMGADFVRADLHIHSYGKDDGSIDVKDPTMTPENIVDKSIQNKLSIISITDHNEINNSKKAIDYSNGKDILVIPGIEVTTTQGHLLVYFESFSDLRKFHGKLNISEDKERCSQGIIECLEIAASYGGIGILAHIELDSGFEKVIGRFSKVIEDVFTHPNLFALEISKKSSSNLYTDDDDSNERKSLVKARRNKLSQSDDYVLPKVMSSDSHSLEKLGKNAEGENKLTRIKIDSLCFQAFRNALLSHESRIRLEDFIPERIPHIVGLSIKGGLLDGQAIKFSKNLTCIIGGRGTGKSTLLESLRESTGNHTNAKIVDSEVWPDEIDLLFEDEAGRQILFKREKNGFTYNASDSENGISVIGIESYGQGETTETIKHSDEDPRVLLEFLDGFLDVNIFLEEDQEIRDLLLNNQSELGKTRVEVAAIPETKKQITNLEDKKKKLEKDKVGDLVKYQTSLITERSIREGLVGELKELIDKYKDALGDDETFEYFSNMSDENIIIGKEEFEKVKSIVEEFSKIVSTKSGELNESLNSKIDELRVQIKLWKSKESNIQKSIDEKKSDLEAKGIPFDIGKINQIANDLEHYKKRLRKLNESEKYLKRLEQDRKNLIIRRKKIKANIYKQRLAFALKINENLKNTVDGLIVSANYIEGCYSPHFENSIKQLMDWRTSQVPKAALIAESMSPIKFSECIKNNNLSSLKTIKDKESRQVFNDADIRSILDRCRSNYNYEDFESLEYEDRPALQVTKLIEKPGGKKTPITRSIAQLSLGQQQSIILAILIQSRSSSPLLIDQPEDNLDSEFIFKTIVSNLRKIKEKRQVIIVTHNPNIAVLGDAELIIPLKSTSIKTHIVERGSIDRKEISDLCCDILEGGKRAFISRYKLYGIDN